MLAEDARPGAARERTRALEPAEARHNVRIRHRVGMLTLDVDFTLDRHWTVLFGPSGAGKTTILRILAGLVRPDYARIVSTIHAGTDQERSLTLVDTEAGLFVPAHRRAVRLAPQQANLFPHMTVHENVSYGANSARRDASEEEDRRLRVGRLLTDFRILQLARKRPAQLSGGEARRAALARTVASSDCRLLLLDEPFTGLDLALRDELIAMLLDAGAYCSTGQVLSVTHDVGEAYQLGGEIVRIAEGRVVAQGPVETVLAKERERLLGQLRGPAPGGQGAGHAV